MNLKSFAQVIVLGLFACASTSSAQLKMDSRKQPNPSQDGRRFQDGDTIRIVFGFGLVSAFLFRLGRSREFATRPSKGEEWGREAVPSVKSTLQFPG